MNLLAFIVITGLLALAFGVALSNPRKALYWVIFLLPWTGLELDVGLRVTAYQVFLAPLIAVTACRYVVGKTARLVLPGAIALTAFILYSTLWSLLQILSLPQAEVIGGPLRHPHARAILQIVMFLFSISPVLLVPLLLRTPNDLLLAGKVYLSAVFMLACLGWLQLLLWYGTGSNPLPIGLLDGLLGTNNEVREGIYEFFDRSVYRMNSLAGEPKYLGASLVLGLLIVQAILFTAKISNGRKLVCLWVFLAASTFATLSTTAFFMWAIGTLAYIAALSIFKLRYEKTGNVVLPVMGALLLALLLLSEGAQLAGMPVADMLLDRTINRVLSAETGIFEDFDHAVKDYLIEHPKAAITGVGLGNIHLFADSYLSDEAVVYAGGGVFTAKAQYLRMISEVGVIGLLCFVCWYWELVRSTAQRLKSASGFRRLAMAMPFAASFIPVLFAVGTTLPQFYMTAGLIAGLHNLLSRSADEMRRIPLHAPDIRPGPHGQSQAASNRSF